MKGNDEMDSTENANQRDALCGRKLGDYEILRRVGGGATSDVFLARQVSLGRKVALKILKDELAYDETYVKRFLQEARSAARLEHPNVVRVYEVGELVEAPRFNGWRRFLPRRKRSVKTYRFIAQEYVAGMSLAQYLRRNGAASIPQTFSALEQIASALKLASELQIVHRDVKPENVIIDANGVIKVVDFGLARPIGPTDATWAETSLTRTGIALGTPLYMSPEQARGGKVDSRSDVYSLGVTAYRMITGVAPFKGETPLAVVIKHLNDKPRPIRELRPDAPPALAALIEKMLEKNPNDRPDSPATLLQELAAAKKAYLRELQNEETRPLDASDVRDGASESCAQFDSASEASKAPDSSDAESRSFFVTPEERDAFERAMTTTALSLEWRSNRQKLEETRRAINGSDSGRKLGYRALWTSLAFFLGGGVLIARNALQNDPTIEPPLAIQRFDSVEEQYVFALQNGSSDAWKSIIEYFPNEEYWTSRAQRQLALAYVYDRDVEAAEEVFNAISKERGGETDPFAIAGVAWLAASRSDFARATAALSELSFGRSHDRMTETLVGKAREIMQKRFGLSQPGWNFNGANSNYGANGMNGRNQGFQRGEFNGRPPFGAGSFGSPGRPGSTNERQPSWDGDIKGGRQGAFSENPFKLETRQNHGREGLNPFNHESPKTPDQGATDPFKSEPPKTPGQETSIPFKSESSNNSLDHVHDGAKTSSDSPQ